MLSFQWAECGAWMMLAQAAMLCAYAANAWRRDFGARAVQVVPAVPRARARQRGGAGSPSLIPVQSAV